MLRRLRVRSKLLVMLAPPLVATILFAAGDVADRQAESAASRRSAALVHLAVTADELVVAYQAEVVEALEPAAPGVLTEALARRREATDALAARFTLLSQEILEGRLGPEILRAGLGVADRIGELADVRKSLPDIEAHGVALTTAVGGLLDRIPPFIADENLKREVEAYAALAHTRQLASERAAVTGGALGAPPDPSRLAALDAGLSLWAELYEVAVGEVPAAQLRGIIDGGGSDAVAGVTGLAQQDAGALVETAEELRTSSARDTIVAGVTALSASWIALTLAIIVGRRIVRPVQRLTDAAHEVAQVQLPALLASMEEPDAPAVVREPVRREGGDEIGDLADAFNSIQTVALDVAERQSAMLKKGVSELFVNMARRNQSLIERQLSCLDGLQADEKDPERLEALFKLDHLGIRMRRHAENLLILAGVEQTRRWHNDVALSAVLRAAYAEVEHMSRIDLGWIGDVAVSGGAAADVAHIVSELLENATSFSPPSSRVELSGYRAGDEFVVTVTDRGVGMSTERLAEANATLARPPVPGLALSRALGFVVVSRLAARWDIRITLATSPFGGILASVVLPATILRTQGAQEAAPAGQRTNPPASPKGPEDLRDLKAPKPPVSLEHDIDHQLAALVGSAPSGPGMPARSARAEGKTSSGLPRRNVARQTEPGTTPAAPAPGETRAPSPAPGSPAPAAGDPAGVGARTEGAAGRASNALARRVPGKSRTTGSGAAPAPSAPAPGAPTSAEEKRARLDGYWNGLQRARTGNDDE